MAAPLRTAAIALLAAAAAFAYSGDNVLLVLNRNSPASMEIGEYYARARGVPGRNVCAIRAPSDETVSRAVYEKQIEAPIRGCLLPIPLSRRNTLRYLVTTKGVPLRISGRTGTPQADAASVDSELTLLPRRMDREDVPTLGPIPNPFFGKLDERFDPAVHRFIAVTRLTGYTFEDAIRSIDRCRQARNRGQFAFDLALKTGAGSEGDEWLREAANALPPGRVRLEKTAAPLTDARGVIGYASWGSNDPGRADLRRRSTGFEWLPGAIAVEFVSTDGRTFREPPEDWVPSRGRAAAFAGSAQSLTADLVREGVSGASGHVYEPFLTAVPRPRLLFGAYYEGRDLAEAYYLAIPYLSWMNVVVGDPLCSIGPPPDGER